MLPRFFPRLVRPVAHQLPFQRLEEGFSWAQIGEKDLINAMVKWRQGVIYGQWRIHESDFIKIEIPVLTVEEQRQIGAFLDSLDNLITPHQRKPASVVIAK